MYILTYYVCVCVICNHHRCKYTELYTTLHIQGIAYICIHRYYSYIYIYIYIYIVHTWYCLQMYTHVFYMCVCVCVCVCVQHIHCLQMYTYILCVCVCLYIYIYTRQMPVANCNSNLNRDSLCLDCWEILSTNTKLQNILLVPVALAQRILQKMICYKEPCL